MAGFLSPPLPASSGAFGSGAGAAPVVLVAKAGAVNFFGGGPVGLLNRAAIAELLSRAPAATAGALGRAAGADGAGVFVRAGAVNCFNGTFGLLSNALSAGSFELAF